jgi:radical SAM protein with 4Fe4S-binding SPASM domain
VSMPRGNGGGAGIGAFSRLGSFWANRAFLRHVAEKFRLEPLASHVARRITSRPLFETPPIVILQVPEVCNLRCKMCYEWGTSGHRHQQPGPGAKPVSLAIEVIEGLIEECRKERTLTPDNCTALERLSMYLRGRWQEMRDYKKGHCIAPWVATDVTARGDVAPCHTFYDLVFGNLHSQGMREIWNGEGFERFRISMRSGLLPVCPACCHFYGLP